MTATALSLIRHVANKLATRRTNIIGSSGAYGDGITCLLQNLPKISNRCAARPTVVAHGKRVKRNNVNLAGKITKKLGEFAGMLPMIIDTSNERIFYDRNTLVIQARHIAFNRIQQHRDRVFFIYGYQ